METHTPASAQTSTDSRTQVDLPQGASTALPAQAAVPTLPIGSPPPPLLQKVFDQLHARMTREAAERDQLSTEERNSRLNEWMLPVGEEVGRFMHLLIQTMRVRRVLELGTSVGYSTLWLADAVRRTGGTLISLDALPEKHRQAREYLQAAQLLEYVQLITAEALPSLRDLPGRFDFVLLDLWKYDYLPCFEALQGKLAPDAVIVADNMINGASEHTRGYQMRVRSAADFQTVLLPIGNGIEYSLFFGDSRSA